MHVTFEDDEHYKRKFKTRPFSISLDKMSEKDIEECKQKYKSSGHNGGISHYSPNKENTETDCSRRYVSNSRSSTPNCNCRCESESDEDYYKELFHIQECQISLPRMNDAETNKKGKLSFIFDYLTFCFVLKICFSIIIASFVLYFL